ncbi:hypothetical protein ACEWY4_023697 [Coilia grayii]|uniref:THAP-type domain-containing protein n=1 Tax=Coilia grayii TaxID=363190 RepID=A0ABD1IYA3_9TELE
MPESCIAWNCKHRRNQETKSLGITFHKFPKAKDVRKKWEAALLKKDFTASRSSMLCNKHFREEDIDRTGQTVRIRDGAIPSVFDFPAHLQKLAKKRALALRKKQESKPLDLSQPAKQTDPLSVPNASSTGSCDHSYGLSTSPADLKVRLSGALARVASLERQLRNAKVRERRAKNLVCRLVEDLKKKNLMNEELKEKLDLYADFPVHLLPRYGHEYTKDQREFALTLHLHGPKAYDFLRKALHLNLPHPHTLQRYFACILYVLSSWRFHCIVFMSCNILCCSQLLLFPVVI